MRQWLRNLRNEHQYTMKEMGEKLGISESYYCAIENGKRQNPMDMVIASGLSTILNLPVSQIVALEKDQK